MRKSFQPYPPGLAGDRYVQNRGRQVRLATLPRFVTWRPGVLAAVENSQIAEALATLARSAASVVAANTTS
jgi:hypothetical protein